MIVCIFPDVLKPNAHRSGILKVNPRSLRSQIPGKRSSTLIFNLVFIDRCSLSYIRFNFDALTWTDSPASPQSPQLDFDELNKHPTPRNFEVMPLGFGGVSGLDFGVHGVLDDDRDMPDWGRNSNSRDDGAQNGADDETDSSATNSSSPARDDENENLPHQSESPGPNASHRSGLRQEYHPHLTGMLECFFVTIC